MISRLVKQAHRDSYDYWASLSYKIEKKKKNLQLKINANI